MPGLFPLHLMKEAGKYSLGRRQMLKSRKQIGELFDKGNQLFLHPLRVSWKISALQEGVSPVLVGVSVSKRNFKKAADRNRIKRLLRECYRLNKQEFNQLVQSNQQQVNVFFIYVDKTIPTFEPLQDKMRLSLKKLASKISS
jgi:ribonuclease P protein component